VAVEDLGRPLLINRVRPRADQGPRGAARYRMDFVGAPAPGMNSSVATNVGPSSSGN
jgi:hypothetical protein